MTAFLVATLFATCALRSLTAGTVAPPSLTERRGAVPGATASCDGSGESCQLASELSVLANTPQLPSLFAFNAAIPPNFSTQLTPAVPEAENAAAYPLPQTRFAQPGFQTRTSILPVFPEIYFSDAAATQLGTSSNSTASNSTQPGSGRRLAAAPPATGGTGGGWTMFSTDSGVVAIHLTALSNGQLLLIERPVNREAPPQIAAVYNIYNNTWRYFPMTDSPFCSGHIQLLNDKVLIVGGDNVDLVGGFADGRYNVRVFSGGLNPSYNVTARMQPYPPSALYDPSSGARWYPSVLTMTDGNVLIVSGQTTQGGGYASQAFTYVNPTYQFFLIGNSTVTNARFLQLLQDSKPINLYPFMTVLPNTGAVMVLSGSKTRFYRYSPAQLLNDTSTYPVIPDLPVPICYPQTASVVLLPLEPPNYAVRVLVVGGSSVDRATSGTPASSKTYLLDLSLRNPSWQVETMSAARVMPDAVLLPDGTVFISNGADTGIAGGLPGGAAAYNQRPAAQAGEIYNPAASFGGRMSGLLASSGRDRLYHSVSWLTPNAEVLVTGSEATEDYSMQIFTPPYLRGSFVRPMLGTPSTKNPPYNSTFRVSLYFVGGPPVNITRAVLTKQGGATHSVHFDQRQVALLFSATTTSITLTAPPDATIAPPGIYQLYVVGAGRPSQAVNIGLGGATPQDQYLEPQHSPLLPDGTYTISTTGRTASCGSFLTALDCSAGNVVSMGSQGAAGVWSLKYVPHASKPDTYTAVHFARSGYCNSYLGAQPCGNGNAVLPFSRDDLSGRQEWTISKSPGGGYYIQVLVGREDCTPLAPYLSAAPCGISTVSVTSSAGSLANWTLTPVSAPVKAPQQPFVPLFRNGTYTLSSVGRQGCTNLVNTDRCGVGNGVFADTTAANFTLVEIPTAEESNTYRIFASARGACNSFLSSGSCPTSIVDLYSTDDDSGRQEFVLSQANGGYYIRVANGRLGCADYLSARSCGSSPLLTLAASGAGSGLQIWTIRNASIPLGPLIPSGKAFNITNIGRSGCGNVLQAQGCAEGTGASMGTWNGSLWQFNYLQTAPRLNTYQLISTKRTGQCNPYLSTGACPSNLVDIFSLDDNSGRQQFTFTAVANGFTIQVTRGRDGCATYLSALSCTSGGGLTLTSSVDATNLAVWNVSGLQPMVAAPPPPPSPPAPSGSQIFADGTYQILSLGRASCARYLSALPCTSGNNVLLGSGGSWTLVHLPSAPQANTYEVQFSARLSGLGTCPYTFLSASRCPDSLVDLFFTDDGSGRQQWTFVRSGGGYLISVSTGRSDCAALLSADSCTESTGVGFAAASDDSGLQLWNVVPPVQSAPSSQILPNGNYYITSSARAACDSYLGGVTCGNDSVTVGTTTTPDGSGTQIWTLVYLPDAAQANTYNIINSGRPGCSNRLSAPQCPNNFVDLFSSDDGSGRQQWVVSDVGGGYTLSTPNGRSGCGRFLGIGGCGSQVFEPIFVTTDNGNGQQTWSIRPVDPAAG